MLLMNHMQQKQLKLLLDRYIVIALYRFCQNDEMCCFLHLLLECLQGQIFEGI